MREITNEERKRYNRYVRQHEKEVAQVKSGAPLLAFIFVLIGAAIFYNFKDPFFHYIGFGFIGLAALIMLIDKLHTYFSGHGNDSFHKH